MATKKNAPAKQVTAKAGNRMVKAGTSKEAAADRKVLFIEAYIANGRNGKDAAIAAGFSPKTAEQQASRLLRDVKVQQQLRARQTALAAKFELRTEDVLRELARIVYADPRKFFNADGSLKNVTELDDDSAAALAGIEVVEMQGGAEIGGGEGVKHIAEYTKKVKFWDKNAAIDKAMKHLGQYEKDNAQKHPLAEMTPEQLDRFIERKAKEAGVTLH